MRAKLLLRFIGELVNCGLVQAQEYGDLMSTLCASYVTTEQRSDLKQPCRDLVASMVLSGVLRAGPALSKVGTSISTRLLNFTSRRTIILFAGDARSRRVRATKHRRDPSREPNSAWDSKLGVTL